MSDITGVIDDSVMLAPKTYLINEVFYSIQGEGILAGTPMVFIRFAKCNMKCDIEPGPKSPGGFACDTEFESGRRVTLDELDIWMEEVCDGYYNDIWSGGPKWILLTGGEPALQVDQQFCDYYHRHNFNIAIETNGSIELPIIGGDGSGLTVAEDTVYRHPFDWICVSPKVAEHAIKQRHAHEVKYVRGYGQPIPQTKVNAQHYLISPATSGLDHDQRTIQWCVELVKQNPIWRLTAQLHKLWEVH